MSDYIYKDVKNREFTTPEKAWYEERPGKANSVYLNEVWTDTVPTTPPAISNDVVKIISDQTLTKDPTTEENKAWYVCSDQGVISTRLYDFISPDKERSNKYSVKIFDDNGEQLLIDEIDWEFDYKNGLLTFYSNPEDKGYATPFHIYAYQYIGGKASKDMFGVHTLDGAYDGQSGEGSGAQIDVDAGPVVLNASNGSAALKILPIDYLPEDGLTGGEIINYQGVLYLHDNSRSIWLSMNRQAITFGAKRADGIYLNVSDFSSNMSGWPALRDGVILGITAQASGGYGQKKIELYKSQSSTPIFQFNLDNLYYANGELNIPFDKNDLIKVLASSEFGTVYNLVVNLEVAWAIR